MVDERISRAIDNDHTAAMKITSDGRKLVRKKNGSTFTASGNVFVCTICKKLFKNHLIYRKHLKIHSEKSHICNICSKGFVYKHHLMTHMVGHTKNQHHQCQLCHKRFSQKGNLNQHLKFHTSKKPFKCDECKKDFYQQEHLKAHMRQHTNERPYQCEICNKSFNIKSSLQRHMNCHTGAKPFICDICNRGYTRRSVLMLHIQQVHENKKPYQCSECQMCFSQKGNLQAHFRRKHLQPKSDSKRGKDRDKGKRTVRKQQQQQPYKQNSKLLRKSPTKNVITNVPDIYSRNKLSKADADGVSLNGDSSKLCNVMPDNPVKIEPTEELDDFQVAPDSHDIVSELCMPSMNVEETIAHPYRLNVGPLENGELYRLLSGDGMICDSDSSDSLPTFHNPYAFSNENLQDDVKILSEFDTLLADAKGWEDYLLADPELLDPSTASDILCSPSKISSGLSKTDVKEELFPNLSLPLCHDYACPPLENIDDIPSSCGKTVLPQKSPAKKDALKPVHKRKKKNVVIMGDVHTNGEAMDLSFYKQHKVHLSSGAAVLA